jgi:hypothetical protein
MTNTQSAANHVAHGMMMGGLADPGAQAQIHGMGGDLGQEGFSSDIIAQLQ